MRRGKRRGLRLGASLLALALVAAACGGDDDTAPDITDPAGDDVDDADVDDTDDADAPDDGDASEATGEDISFDLWHIQTDHPWLLEDAADRYMADNPNVTVNVNGIENDAYKTQIAVALGANEPPCIFMSWGGGPLIQYVEAGQVVDLTDYIAEDNYRDRFVDVSWGNVEVDDRVYGIPVENVSAAFIWYNEQIFDDLGLETPDTWSELLEVIDALNEADIYPFALANQAPWPGSMYYMYLVDRLGGPEVFEAAATRSGGSFEDPVFIRAGELLQELVDRDAFNPGFNGLDWGAGQSRALLYSGDAAMELMGNWTTSVILTENEDWYENNLGFFKFPDIEEGEGDPSNVLGTVGNNYYHVSSRCEHPDEAFEMIQYIIDDEGVEARAEIGRILPIADFVPEDPFVQEIFEATNEADSVQLWYDQYLPPEMADVHLEAVQALFEGSITPEEKARRMEEAAVNYFGE